MRVPWSKIRPPQLDLLSGAAVVGKGPEAALVVNAESSPTTATSNSAGQPLMLPRSSLREDPNNPRTEFPESELEELAEDIRQHRPWSR
jgi:hypothetical protein